MKLEEILQVEVKALSQTICEYSTDNFITSYAKQLNDLHYPEDRDKLKMLTERLLEWYTKEIETIRTSRYVHSKESHLRSYWLLQEIEAQLK